MIDFSNWLNSTNIQSSQFLKLHPAKHLTIIGMLFCGISTFCLFCKYLDRNNADGYWISEAFGFRFAISLPPYLSQLFFCIFRFAFGFPLFVPSVREKRKVGWTDFGKDLSFRQLMLSIPQSSSGFRNFIFTTKFILSLFLFFRKLRWWSWWCCRCWRQIRLMNE